MDTSMIRVQPSSEQRTEFARWAVGQSPRIRTSSPWEFAVPADLFTLAPESVLVGSLVDGHPYRAVEDEGPVETPQAGVQDFVDTLYRCEDCDKTSTSAAGLAAHRRAKHPEGA